MVSLLTSPIKEASRGSGVLTRPFGSKTGNCPGAGVGSLLWYLERPKAALRLAAIPRCRRLLCYVSSVSSLGSEAPMLSPWLTRACLIFFMAEYVAKWLSWAPSSPLACIPPPGFAAGFPLFNQNKPLQAHWKWRVSKVPTDSSLVQSDHTVPLYNQPEPLCYTQKSSPKF